MSKNTFNYDTEFTKVFNNNPTPFAHDRTKSVGASEAFGCIREIWFKKNLERSEIDGWGYMERGNAVENYFMVPYLYDIFGKDNCVAMGEEQTTLFDGKASATPDGLIINQPRDLMVDYGIDDLGAGKCLVVEFKSFDDRANIYSEKAIHRGQAIMQMGMFRKTTNHKPEWAQVIYVNASDYQDIRVFSVKFDEEVYQRGLDRAEEVFSATDANDLKPEGKFSDQCQYCDFHEQCGEATLKSWAVDKDADEISADVRKEISGLVEEINSLTVQASEAEKARKELRHSLQELVLKQNVNRVEDPSWLVSVTKSKGRKTLDKKKLEKDLGISLKDYEKSGNPFLTVRVTDRKPK